MNYLASASSALTTIDTFLINEAQKLDDEAKAALVRISAQVSPVDKIVNFSEIIYALGERATAEAKTAAASTVEFATRFAWHGLGMDGRGVGIMSAFLRDLGETHPTGQWPDKSTDPEPRSDLGITVPATKSQAPAPAPAA